MIPSHIKEKIIDLRPNYFTGAFDKLFCWRDLENLLNLRPYVNSQRFKIINDKQYSWKNQGWLTDIDSYPPSLIQQEIEENLCLIIDASRVNKKINSVCKDLEAIFPNSCSDAHIYFTVANNLSSGFGIHCDESHNLIVQMEGCSLFEVWDQEVRETDPAIKIALSPGDAIFIPMKVYHRVTSLTERLSISFPVSASLKWEPQDRHWVKIT